MSMLRSSAAEFKNVKSVVTAALLIALHTVLAVFVSFQVTDSLRISVSFVANVAIGCMYGPVMGFVCGAVGDIVQFVIKPTGLYFPGWTLSAALACMIYGIFFYKRFPVKKDKSVKTADRTAGSGENAACKEADSGRRAAPGIDLSYLVRTILAVAVDVFFVNVLMGTYWVTVMYGKGFAVYFTVRFIKNIVQIPVNVVLSYFTISLLRDIQGKHNLNS